MPSYICSRHFRFGSYKIQVVIIGQNHVQGFCRVFALKMLLGQCLSEIPESLVSDSKGRVSRSRTRLGLGLGFEIQGCSRIGLGLGLVITFCAVLVTFEQVVQNIILNYRSSELQALSLKNLGTNCTKFHQENWLELKLFSNNSMHGSSC